MANMIEQSLLCKVLDAPDLEITQLQQKSGFIVVTPDDFEGRKPNVDEIKSLAIKHGADMIVIPLQTISDKTGISRSTIYAFLYNGTDLSSMRLAKICSLLGLSMDYVMGLKEKPDGKM